MIKLIRNTKQLDESLKEDKVIKSKKLRESLKTKISENEDTSFELDEPDYEPEYLTSNPVMLPRLQKIEEIVKSYDLNELCESRPRVIEMAVNDMILDCIETITPRLEAYSDEWNEVYKKLEKLVYKVVKHLGYLKDLRCGFDKDVMEAYSLRTSKKSSNSNVDKIDKLIDDIYDERKSSIAKDGEYGVGNQTFKEFRNRGYLAKLKKLKQQELNKELSLESLKDKENSK